MGNQILEEYRKKVVIFILAIVMLSATAAAVVLPALKGFGLYPNVTMLSVVIFISIIVVEDIVGVYMIKKSMEYTVLTKKYETGIKMFLLLLMAINLNLIIWIFPSKESWMFAFYFLILMAFFLDMKHIIVCCCIEFASLLILFIFNPITRPVESLFWSDVVLRTICIVLSLLGVIILMAFVEKF